MSQLANRIANGVGAATQRMHADSVGGLDAVAGHRHQGGLVDFLLGEMRHPDDIVIGELW